MFLKVYCSCQQPWGGSNCGIDLTNTPDIHLDRKCCDLRTENCDLIEGFGSPLSTTDKIFIKAELIEVKSY